MLYIPFLLFLFLVYRTFDALFVLITSSIFAVLLGGLLLSKALQASIPAVIIYLFIFFNVINFMVGISLVEFYVFPLIIPFIPIILFHYFYAVKKKIPGSSAFFIMIIGFLVTVIYQTIAHCGVYPYSMFGDGQFFRGFIIFFILYMLLAFRTLSIWKVIVALSLSVVPQIIYVLALYIVHFHGNISFIFSERLGTSIDVSPNQVAIWLDVAFPLALFIALYDNRPKIKSLFSVVALFYGAALLLSASRGSLVGLPLIPFFIAFKTKSIRLKILVIIVSLAGMGIFGREILARSLNPCRADMLSSFGRIELLRSGYHALKANHYLFGIGMDNFKGEKYNFNFMRSFDAQGIMSTHNVFFEIWLGWGLLGLFGWLAFIGQGVFRVARARLRPEVSYLKPALILAISLALLHSLFDSSMAAFPYLVFFFTLIASAFFLCESEEMRQPSTNPGVIPGTR